MPPHVALSDAVARDVADHVDRHTDDMVAFLGRYVRFRSVNPGMLEDRSESELADCQEWIAETIRGWGVFDSVELVAKDPKQPNVVAYRKGDGKGRSLLFNGHSDVVPVTDDQAAAWREQGPWSGDVADGVMWGRGAVDMKGGVTSFLWAMKTLGELGIGTRGDLIATVVSGEETGNHRIGVGLLGANGHRADIGIVAEPTRLEICPATIGEFYFRIEVCGRSTHLGARNLAIYPQPYGVPVSGVNAIDKMWKIQSALSSLEREWGVWQRHPLMPPGQMSINFSRIQADGPFSSMADACELTGSVLFNPSVDFETAKAEFLRAIASVTENDYWLREHPPAVTVPYILDEKPPMDLPPEHPACQALAAAQRRVLKSEPVIACAPSTNDGNYMAAAGQEVITCGPGSNDDGAHGPDEHIAISDVVDGAKLFAVGALEWTNGAGA